MGTAATTDPQTLVNQALMPRRQFPPQYLLLIGGVCAVAALLLVSGAGGFMLPARLAMVLFLASITVALFGTVRRAAGRFREEQKLAETLYDMVRLRNWDGARRLSSGLLGRDFLNRQAKIQVLTLWSLVLGRDGQHETAAAVQGALLERIQGPGTVPLLTGRAMALLRCDRLVDADTALRDLRRTLSAQSDIPTDAQAGLMLAEMYRDVQTNHLDEVLEVYDEYLELLREGLGVRVADVHALAAVAMFRREDGRWSKAWHKATLLADCDELTRRYPEVAVLEGASA